MTAVHVQPLRPASSAVCHVQVADGAISLRIAGDIRTDNDVTSVVDELAEACGLCCGTVLVDVTRCAVDGELLVALIGDAALRAERTRCRVRVLVNEPEVAFALTSAGIAHAELPADAR
ncbi:hypothetical protein MUY14_43405 [Amycolatopsis sp. FBCC-B4732]|uniref:hypothetical protein n=1 Tax=Amycolatopsis sp. FBCC-B4732 TaxID=3079339 RepID=UPI001FF3C439|nr:hypothetical protein [Amycolatopsis sp. FBCC-B4732]UOX88453.1 hypothetical protein MUY14_43405 [Amycolatopsis sp. FBCC-B4732]